MHLALNLLGLAAIVVATLAGIAGIGVLTALRLEGPAKAEPPETGPTETEPTERKNEP